jgi:hypothetical protein
MEGVVTVVAEKILTTANQGIEPTEDPAGVFAALPVEELTAHVYLPNSKKVSYLAPVQEVAAIHPYMFGLV